jgi:DNA repair exonuclease SbcCD ATPase subunit
VDDAHERIRGLESELTKLRQENRGLSKKLHKYQQRTDDLASQSERIFSQNARILDQFEHD